ncbi:hypothetical protein BDW22DRAFT_1429219 [Trametopsis cervina]|nr:hypothetical protein BDW22DRAFT_1429219 [Trametopsis cervina]
MAPPKARTAQRAKTDSKPTVGSQSRNAVPNDQPKPFFPYLRYTSLVGVHASLLAFTAVILPRSAFADFSTPAQYKTQRRDPMVVMTEAPWRTVAWMCLGSLVLQWWWAGWVREWRLEASVNMDTAVYGQDVPKEDEVQKVRRIMRQKEWDSQKPEVTWKAALSTLVASVGFHVLIVLFGAPISSHPVQTYMLAVLLSLLTVWTPAYVLGPPIMAADSDSLVRRMTWIRLFAELSPRNPIERSLVYPTIGALLGCWAGVIPIGLDWERPWQVWPLTPAWGALSGYILGSLWALLVTDLKEIVELGITARRDDEQARPSGKKAKQKST